MKIAFIQSGVAILTSGESARAERQLFFSLHPPSQRRLRPLPHRVMHQKQGEPVSEGHNERTGGILPLFHSLHKSTLNILCALPRHVPVKGHGEGKGSGVAKYGIWLQFCVIGRTFVFCYGIDSLWQGSNAVVVYLVSQKLNPGLVRFNLV